MSQTPDLSVIIVNWNRLDDVTRNVERVRRLCLPRCEIIVVDNGSTDGSAERLAGLGSVRLIALGANLGPAAARNVGIEAAAGAYLLFLDSDALLGRRGLLDLIRRMDADDSLGVVGFRVVNSHTRRLDQWIYAEPWQTHEHLEFETYSFSAAGALIRAEALRRCGPFWGDLFIYNEEVDLSIRVIRAGYRILYYPAVTVFHLASASGRVGSDAYWYYQIRNWIWIFYRYYPPMARLRMIAAYSLIYLVRSVLALRLGSCLGGVFAGLRRTEIVSRYADKLSGEEVRQLRSLKSRGKLTWLAAHRSRNELPSRRRAMVNPQ